MCINLSLSPLHNFVDNIICYVNNYCIIYVIVLEQTVHLIYDAIIKYTSDLLCKYNGVIVFGE